MRFITLTSAAIGVLLLLCSCQPKEKSTFDTPPDPYSLPAMDGDFLNVIVEIPAGTNHKIEFRNDSGFTNDTVAGGDPRVINFLPYPGNYGFVPSTLMDKERGGDGDPLDVLVLSESVPTGALIAVQPIGALLLRDRGEIDTKIIAVPRDSSLRVFTVDNYLDFALKQDAARQIIETWFLNYKGPNKTELLRWEDETYAWREVRKWQKR
ncbi:inorganic diphosphatase [Lewinella sp. 4G2]|uniref:inorganic diphosphatase n=1 Tax=Lewinella sp. 4G2 TaxID=1803372 RepID=UPI0007B4F5F7|nr:inorganic diphosphatase [Lewinella sp. 4G2]OAV44984.1 inorganic pyrophosphatase [Lewinella sp. 4G2]